MRANGPDAVIGPLATVVVIALGLVALWALVEVLRNRPLNVPLLAGCAVLEVLLLAQAVVGVARLIGTDRAVPAATFLAYLVGAVLVLPVAVFWAVAERSRYGTAVVIVACLALIVMVARMLQLWPAQ